MEQNQGAAETSTPITEYTDIPHTMTRRTIARRLTEAKQTVPHFYLKLNCEIDNLLALRQKINAGKENKVSVNDLIIKAVALAYKEVPEANVCWGEDAVRQFNSCDVSVAVATPRGLVTPIVCKADEKSVFAISEEIKELAARGRVGRLKKEEYMGGHVSVSNLGMFGIEEFSAIINPPQSCIFAIGAGVRKAVVKDDQIKIATVMSITASVDHRVVDGALAAKVLTTLKRLLEQPEALAA